MTVTTKVTELAGSRVRLDAEVPGEEVESRVQRAARQIGQEMRIPGFRKGKVPGPMVIQRIGRDAVLEQAVRDSLPEWYEEAIMRAGVSASLVACPHKGHDLIAYGIWEAARKLDQNPAQKVIHLRRVFYADRYSPRALS